MLRKHINSLEPFDFDKVPFYSWNCISIVMSHRPVDLVLRDEKDMERLLKFLIYKMKTVDGNKGSGTKILDQLMQETIDTE